MARKVKVLFYGAAPTCDYISGSREVFVRLRMPDGTRCVFTAVTGLRDGLFWSPAPNDRLTHRLRTYWQRTPNGHQELIRSKIRVRVTRMPDPHGYGLKLEEAPYRIHRFGPFVWSTIDWRRWRAQSRKATEVELTSKKAGIKI